VSCSAYPLVSAFYSGRRRAVCKTVSSAYVGSNPTPATTSENGPLAAETRPAGRLLNGGARRAFPGTWAAGEGGRADRGAGPLALQPGGPGQGTRAGDAAVLLVHALSGNRLRHSGPGIAVEMATVMVIAGGGSVRAGITGRSGPGAAAAPC